MASGISIGVAADTRQFQKAISAGVVEPLDDAQQTLAELGKAGDTAGDKIEKGVKTAGRALDGLGKDGDKAGDKISDSARDAKTDVARLEDAFKDAANAARKETKSAGDAIKSNVGDGVDGAKRGLDDFKEESASTAKESAASFDGSADSIVDAFQEVAANAFIGFGPAGLVAGLAAAAGIGLISAAIQSGSEDSEALKAKVGELTAELIDAGDKGGPSLDYLSEQLKTLASESDDGATSLADLRKVADDSGNSFEDLAKAYAGSLEELQKLNGEGEDRLKALQDEAEAIDTTTNAGVDRYAALEKQIDAQDKLNGYVSEATQRAEEAAQAEQNYADAGGQAMETRKLAVETYQSALDDSLSSFDDFRNAETGALDPAGYLAGIQARIDATANFNTNVQDLATRFQLTDEEVQAILDQGIDFAPMLQSIEDSGLDSQFVEKLRTAVGGGQDVLNGADLNATAEVKADTDKAVDATEAFTQQKRDTTVQVKADPKPAQSAIKGITDGSYSATVAVQAAVGDAQATVDRFVRNNDGRTFTITQLVKDRNGNPVI